MYVTGFGSSRATRRPPLDPLYSCYAVSRDVNRLFPIFTGVLPYVRRSLVIYSDELLVSYLPLTSRFLVLDASSFSIIILPHFVPRVSKEGSVDA